MPRRNPFEIMLAECVDGLSLKGLRRDELIVRALYVAALLVLVAIGVHTRQGARVSPAVTSQPIHLPVDDCVALTPKRGLYGEGDHSSRPHLPHGSLSNGTRLSRDTHPDRTEL